MAYQLLGLAMNRICQYVAVIHTGDKPYSYDVIDTSTGVELVPLHI